MTQSKHTFTVKNIKTFTGREGYGYSCNLYLNNKKVAVVTDTADGGPLDIFWDGPKIFDVTTRSFDFEKSQQYLIHKGTEAESILEKMIMELPMISVQGSQPFYSNSEIFIDDLVNDTLLQQKISRMLKKEIFILENKQIISYQIKPTQDSVKINNYIAKNKPTATIINEKPIEEVMKIFKEYS